MAGVRRHPGSQMGFLTADSLLPDPGRIGVEIAPEVPRKKLRLQMRNEAERRHFVQKGMTPLFLFALLPLRQDGAAPVIGEKHGAAVAVSKSRARN